MYACCLQEVQATSQEAIEKLEAAKRLAEEEAAAERSTRERMLAALQAGELPGLQRAATAAADGQYLTHWHANSCSNFGFLATPLQFRARFSLVMPR